MPVLICLICFGAYAAGYLLWGRWLARSVFRLDPARPTPAHVKQDSVDYVPTRPAVLFGHHFTSIAGLSPMVGLLATTLIVMLQKLRDFARADQWLLFSLGAILVLITFWLVVEARLRLRVLHREEHA